jgi:OPT family oligopeptide transporter
VDAVVSIPTANTSLQNIPLFISCTQQFFHRMEFDFDAIDEEDSPYPEVRASVSNIDDPDMPALTIRLWFIGLFLCLLSGGMNMFFNFRYPAPALLPLTLLLIAYPFGKFLAFTLPITTYRLPRFLGSAEFSLNPGPWNIKEHVLVYIMANVAIGPPYAINAVVVMQVYYSVDPGFWFTVLFVLSTQLTGFGLAGICRRFLVWPASMVWPQNLVVCTVLNTLHAEDEEGSGGISRFRYFSYVLTGAFFWYFVPGKCNVSIIPIATGRADPSPPHAGYLFQALSVFSFVCWVVPNNVPVNQLFGVANGLGMSFLTFDWNEIAWVSSPLMVPWWAQVHIISGFVLFFWIVTPILYYTNVRSHSHYYSSFRSHGISF